MPNGARVNKDDVLAEFDTTRQQEETLEVEAGQRADDLGHQFFEKAARNLSEAEKRLSDIKQAEADLNKALIQLKKGPVLPDIDPEAKRDQGRGRAGARGELAEIARRARAG